MSSAKQTSTVLEFFLCGWENVTRASDNIGGSRKRLKFQLWVNYPFQSTTSISVTLYQGKTNSWIECASSRDGAHSKNLLEFSIDHVSKEGRLRWKNGHHTVFFNWPTSLLVSPCTPSHCHTFIRGEEASWRRHSRLFFWFTSSSGSSCSSVQAFRAAPTPCLVSFSRRRWAD